MKIMQARNEQSTIQRWATTFCALLVALSLAGCGSEPDPTPTPFPTLIHTSNPIPIFPRPETPMLDPNNETTVEAGKKLVIRAMAENASWYEWKLVGGGEISMTTGNVIIYTAPAEGEAIANVSVRAYNDQGASPPVSLKLNVPLVPSVRLDALAGPWGQILGLDTAEPLIRLNARPNDCWTGSDCLRFIYTPGGQSGRVYWWPFCIADITVRCQKAEEHSSISAQPLCIAVIRPQGWEEVLRGACHTDILKSGNLSKVNRLSFRVKGDRGGEIVTFGIGGPDVLPKPGRSSGRITLSPNWEKHDINLEGLDLTKASALFYWAATDEDNPHGVIFYLDDIQFEGKKMEVEEFSQNRGPNAAMMVHLRDLLSRLCWIAYSPTHFDPTALPIHWPSEDDVRQDLHILRRAGFDGLVTYGSNFVDPSTSGQMLDIAKLAQEVGFEGMIVGIWDPAAENELRAAEQASRHQVVVGYTVGNEGLNVRYNLKTLTAAMERLRQTTGKPVSTTEEAHDYTENSPLWSISDWIFPNVHPYFASYRDPQEAVRWTEKIFATLNAVSDKPLVFKEVGLPSGGDQDVSETRQAHYYQLLQDTDVAYVVFEAFDAPWKHLDRSNPDRDPEPHWGIFTSNRTPKAVATNICPTQQHWR